MMGLPKIAGSRILCPPRSASVPPMNTTCRVREQPAEFADGIEQQDIGVVGRSARCAAPSAIRDPSRRRATLSKRSGLRGATIKRQPGSCALRRNDEILFGKTVVGRSAGGNPERPVAIRLDEFERRRICDAAGAKSYFRLPPTSTTLRRCAGGLEPLPHFVRLGQNPVAKRRAPAQTQPRSAR